MTEQPNDPLDARAWPEARQWRVSALAALLIGLFVLAAGLAQKVFGTKLETNAPAAAPPGTFRATPQQLKAFTVEDVRAHAFVSEELTEGKIGINADRATPVVSPYSGRVTRVIGGLGDSVKAGAPLATLDAAEFVQAQNDLRVASAQATLARLNETRKHALYDAKGGSLQDWQQAQSDLAAAETALTAARNRLQIFGISEPEIAALEAAPRISPVVALTAPIGGVIVDRQIGPGQFLQAGGNPVFTIADPSSVWLLANVRESDAGLVKVGQLVEVRVLAYPQRDFKARVTHVAALVDPVTHRLPVRAEIDNRDGALKPEMFANFRIITSEASESPAVPEAAVVHEADSAHVWVVAGDLLSYRAIKTGRTNDALVEVVEGLKVGEHIVIKGALFIDQAAAPSST
jgi:cobalt-zinc-cadmium efflux system membrane fusion protein